jgi:hypothetical protein
VPQLARTNPYKQSRETEIDIGYLDAQLKLRPLNRIARLPPWNTTALVEAPQFKDYHNKTTTKENFDLSTTEHYFKRWNPNLHDKCNGSNISGESYMKINDYKKSYKIFNDQNVE